MTLRLCTLQERIRLTAFIGHLQRGMRLTAMIQDTELQLMSDTLNVALTPRVRMKSGVGV